MTYTTFKQFRKSGKFHADLNDVIGVEIGSGFTYGAGLWIGAHMGISHMIIGRKEYTCKSKNHKRLIRILWAHDLHPDTLLNTNDTRHYVRTKAKHFDRCWLLGERTPAKLDAFFNTDSDELLSGLYNGWLYHHCLPSICAGEMQHELWAIRDDTYSNRIKHPVTDVEKRLEELQKLLSRWEQLA